MYSRFAVKSNVDLSENPGASSKSVDLISENPDAFSKSVDLSENVGVTQVVIFTM